MFGINKKRKFTIAPSILSANLGDLNSDINSIGLSSEDCLHVDVMDGVFVPPITFGANVVRAIRPNFDGLIESHLMTEGPERHIEVFASSGSNRIIVHQETCPHLHRTLSSIRTLGVESGVAINPGTPANLTYDVLEYCDLVLVMTVNPGWGGQEFIANCLKKIEALRSFIDTNKLKTLIEVDGGVNDKTARACVEAGADILVAGSYIFGAENPRAAMKTLEEA